MIQRQRILPLLALALLAGAVEAQERNGFFERDFARGSSGVSEATEGSGPAIAATPKPKREGSTRHRPTSPASDISARVQRAKEATGAAAGEGTVAAGEVTRKVTRVGAILNTLSVDHFREKLNELVEVLDKYDLDGGIIYTLGNIHNLSKVEEVSLVVVRGAIVEAVEELPEKYEQVTLSPTWILETAEGDILLEAVGPLGNHLNSKGEFIDRRAMPDLDESTTLAPKK